MLRRKLYQLAAVVLLSFLGLVVVSDAQQIITVAFLNLPNTFSALQTFQQGFALPAAGGGKITIAPPVGTVSSYSLILPSSGGQAGYYVCVGDSVGTLTTLAHCPASGSGGPLMTASPSSLDFGSVAVSMTSTLSVLLINTGNSALTFTGTAFTFTGTNSADFQVSVNTASTCVNSGTLIGGATCTLSIDFTPGLTGARTATLNIADNAPGSPQSVPLSGSGA